MGGKTVIGPHDDPWILHATWSPSCHFIHTTRGSPFVQFIKQHPDITFAITAITDTPNTDSTSDEQLSRKCKICDIKDIGAIFLPCGHAHLNSSQ